jgi:uncharacterized protein YdeI (YjbR/CyaY-like superfamily)
MKMFILFASLAAALAGDDRARTFFAGLARSYRNLYAAWVESAKQEETRKRRLDEMLARLRAGRRLGMK